MSLPADVSVARAELVATAVMWHGSETWAPELHRAVERYQQVRELWMDSLTPLPVEPP